jgi:hypothetical protein
MDADSILIECTFIFGKHAGKCALTPGGARMLSRLFDLTIRPGLANTPGQWESREVGRTYVLEMFARLGQDVAGLAGPGRDITEDLLSAAANKIIRDQEVRFPTILSRFCFCYRHSDLYGGL